MTDRQKICDLISDIKVAMLTTRNSNGQLHSRPMATQPMDPEGKLWFFLRLSSVKSIEVAKEKQVNLTYIKPHCYVSISGRGEITQDPLKIHALWEPSYQEWFPLGLEDEELALLRVDIDAVEYWLSPTGTVTKIVDFAKNLVTGEAEPKGEHGTLNMNSVQGRTYAQN